jgi:hypothetical protein
MRCPVHGQVVVGEGSMAVEVVELPIDGVGTEVEVGVGGVVDTVVVVSAGGIVVARGVVCFFGLGEGEVVGVTITAVPSGATVTTAGAGGRTMR